MDKLINTTGSLRCENPECDKEEAYTIRADCPFDIPYMALDIVHKAKAAGWSARWGKWVLCPECIKKELSEQQLMCGC